MRRAAWVLAYHGCDKEVGEKILSGEKDIVLSRNSWDWLGEGAYFWEYSYSRALAWAKFLQSRPDIAKIPIKEPFVIGAIIDPGNCLDLSEDGSLQIVKEAHSNLKLIFKILKQPMPKNEEGHKSDRDLVKRKLDCYIINYLHRMRKRRKQPRFDTIRCPFMEGGELFEGSKFHAKTHLQWCVRDPKRQVWGYFRPRQVE
jgi:hypothetical protein